MFQVQVKSTLGLAHKRIWSGCLMRKELILTPRLSFYHTGTKRQSNECSTERQDAICKVWSSIPDIMSIDKLCYKGAYSNKRFSELLRAYLVFGLCSFDWLVDNQAKILTTLERLVGQSVFYWIIRQTLYKQFMIGDTQESVVATTSANRRELGVRIQLGYTGAEVHGVVSSRVATESVRAMFDRNFDAMRTSIDWAVAAAGSDAVRPKTAFKLTFLILPDDLEKFNGVICNNNSLLEKAATCQSTKKLVEEAAAKFVANQSEFKISRSDNQWTTSLKTSIPFHLEMYNVLRKHDQVADEAVVMNEINRVYDQMTELSQHASACGVRILWDAEQSYLQDAIDTLVLDQMRTHNRREPVLSNTYQCYRKRTYDLVRRDVELATREGFQFAAKIVRGAYIVEERRLAAEQGYEDPINPTYDATTDMYHKVAEYLLDQTQRPGSPVSLLTFGSHNMDTVKFLLSRMRELGLNPQGERVALAQTVGMRDYITYPLAGLGLPLTKQYHFGPVADGLAWLSRRITENRGGVAAIDVERTLIREEIRRRVLRL